MFTITLKGAAWSAIIATAGDLVSADKASKLMHALYVCKSADVIEFKATDSYAIGMITADGDGDGDGDALINFKSVSHAVKFLLEGYATRERATASLSFTCNADGAFMSNGRGVSIPVAIVEGVKFPDTSTLLNMGDGDGATVAFNPIKLARLADSLTAFHGSKKNAAMASARFNFFGPMRPCTVISSNRDLGLEFVGGLMPVRVS